VNAYPSGGDSTGPPDDRSGRPRGRRPDPALDKAIQAAVVDVLSTEGYGGLTMDAVAVVAGVSKATIYRRWTSKTDLLVSVIEGASEASLGAPDTGALRDDLVALLESLVDVLAGPGGVASRALLTAGNTEPVLAAAFRSGPMARWGRAFEAAFARAVARGEVEPGASRSLAAEAGTSILLKRWLVTGQPVSHELAGRIVDQVMVPLLRREQA
jgi:AcrR family transcriptional regulator